MRTMKPLMTVVWAAALLATTAVPAAAQDGEGPELQARVDEFVGLLPGGIAVITIRDGVRTTATAGIADIEGTPFSVDTPLLGGGTGVIPLYVLVLQLAEDGLISLDAPVTTYLPDAPVADGATVRDVLTQRAGVPLLRGDPAAAVRADPERIFTTDELVRSLSQQRIASPEAGPSTGYSNTLLVVQLIEAATGADVASVLADQVTEPLDMTATRRPEGDPEAVGDVAGGWIAPGDQPTYLPNTSNASRTFRPMVTSAADVATYLSALVAGDLISPELLASTVFDERLEDYAYTIARPDEMSALTMLGPSDTRWFGRSSIAPQTGVYSLAAVAPDSGDVVVVISNNEDLDATALARSIVADWSADVPMTAFTATAAQGTLRYSPLMLCDFGQPSGFDLAPCAVDDEGMHFPFDALYELSGTLDGSAAFSGIQTVRPDDTYRADAQGIFVGEVEGCGTGTVLFSITDAEGYFDGSTVVWTAQTWEVVPGGTLLVTGYVEGLGPETWLTDHSTGHDYVGELACADEPR